MINTLIFYHSKGINIEIVTNKDFKSNRLASQFSYFSGKSIIQTWFALYQKFAPAKQHIKTSILNYDIKNLRGLIQSYYCPRKPIVKLNKSKYFKIKIDKECKNQSFI